MGFSKKKQIPVWLPIRFDGEKVIIEWHDEWRIENFD